MIVFSVDLRPGDGYLKNDQVNKSCIKRNKLLFGNQYKIFTPNDSLVKEAIAFYGEKILNNRPAESYKCDLIRLYLLWKLEEAWYIDADVFVQKADIEKIKNNYGCLNCVYAFFSATNGGCQEGREYWGNICKEIKKDLETGEDGFNKRDGYYYEKLNLKTVNIQEIIIFHYEKWIITCGHNNKRKKFIYLKDVSSPLNVKNDEDLRFVFLNPSYEILYDCPNNIPAFKEIWETEKDVKKYIDEASKLFFKS